MIECIFYGRKGKHRELFYFSYLSTIEVTILLDTSIRIEEAKVFSYVGNEYLTANTISTFTNVEAFNRFFINNPKFYINDCELHLENGLIISTHDDGEVHIEQPIDFENRKLIRETFRIKGLSELLITEMMKHADSYLCLDTQGKIVSVHETFDDYLNNSV